MVYAKSKFSTKRRTVVKPTKRVKYVKKYPKKWVIPRNPFPLKTIAKLRYCETVRLDATTGSSASYLFRANSIFDPNFTGVGHQPYGRDTYESIYNHYRVLKSRISCTFLSNGSSSTGHLVCGVAVKDDSTVELGFDTIRESKGAHYKMLADSTQKATVTNGYNSKKAFPNNVSDLNSIMGTNPSEIVFFQIFTTSANNTIDPSSVDVVVTIDYTCMFWELKDLGQS